MNYKMLSRFLALILAVEAFFMLPALGISYLDGTDVTTRAFGISIAVILVVAATLALLSRGAQKRFFAKEGLFCVGTSWILISLFGCLPFFLSGEIPRFIDALFEMVSGFTDRKSTRLNSSHKSLSRMPSSA